MEAIEERYHLDRYTLQDYGEGLNVSIYKGNTPEVSVVFSPADPREGEKLTARAFPLFFSNPTDQLYYTWYLKRAGCELGSGSGVPSYCDMDGSGGITVNDWKVAAMQILVTDEADRNGFSYDGDDDSDGYESKYGGEMEVNVGNNHKWCSVQDAETGRMFEFENGCFHLFPDPDSGETGDGNFGLSEEEFWGSNPHDSDTADNGNKDEANAVGVGLDSFTWNYQVGDEVGVIVEGTSMVPTQHDDSSFNIMFALSQNVRPRLDGSLHDYMNALCPSSSSPSGDPDLPDSYDDDGTCAIRDIDRKIEIIKGYPVCFLTADMGAGDFDECLEANLVDPLEGGQGRSKKLELSVSASPQNPTNDREEMIAGDIVSVSASVDNTARSANEVKYSWSVGLNSELVGEFTDITEELYDAGLLSSTEGNGLDSLRIAMNMGDELLGEFSDVDPFYMKVAVTARENFGGRVARSGRSDVIIRVSNSDRKIVAYPVEISLVSGSPKLKVVETPICDEYHTNPASMEEISENIDRLACRVVRNEIIGLRVDPDGLEDFRWTINGVPFTCTEDVSDDLSCSETGNEVFFAAAGSPGETYSVRMDAVDVGESDQVDEGSGKSVSLSRTFQIVEPEIVIESTDESLLWPRYVGSFSELGGAVVPEYSDEIFEMYNDGQIPLQARTVPGHLAFRLLSPQWTVDGVPMEDDYEIGAAASSSTFPFLYTPTYPKDIDESYFIDFSATHSYSDEYRLALDRIFDIDVLQTSDFPLSREIRVNVVAHESFAQADEPGRFFATVSRYVPPFVLLAFRMFVTVAIILFSVGFVFSLMPESSSVSPERKRYDM